MTDETIIKKLVSGRPAKRQQALKLLYQELPKVKALIVKSGGTSELAEEIFQDSLMLLIEKVEAPDFKLTSKLSTFLCGIARFNWMNELRKQNRKLETEWPETLSVSANDLGYDEAKEERMQQLDRILNRLNERCQKIFKLFYFDGKSMKEIAKAVGFSTVQSAKTQKYKCLEKAIQLSVELQKTALS